MPVGWSRDWLYLLLFVGWQCHVCGVACRGSSKIVAAYLSLWNIISSPLPSHLYRYISMQWNVKLRVSTVKPSPRGRGIYRHVNYVKHYETCFIFSKGLLARKADSLTSICELIVYKMWHPRRLTIIWASTNCYRGSLYFQKRYQ
jgi:hypothetical protein